MFKFNGEISYKEDGKKKVLKANLSDINYTVADINRKETYFLEAKDSIETLLPKRIKGEAVVKLLQEEQTSLQKSIQKQILKEGSELITSNGISYKLSRHVLYKFLAENTDVLGHKFSETIINEFREKYLSSQIYEIKKSLENENSFYSRLIKIGVVSLEELFKIIKKSLKRLLEYELSIDKNGNYYFEEDDYKLKTLKEILLKRKDKIYVYEGYPGSGKSTAVAEKIANYYTHDKIAVVTLSNLIGSEFASKVKKINKTSNINFFSNTKARLYLNTLYSNIKKSDKYLKELETIVDNDVLVFDEASQLSIYELDLFIDLLEKNETADIYIMSDLNQMKTFLSSGSLSYSIQQMIPECVKLFNEQYRIKKEVWNNVKAITKGDFLFDIKRIDEINFKDIDIMITGVNNSVELCNLMMLYYKHFQRRGIFRDWNQFYSRFRETSEFSSKIDKFRNILELLEVNETIPMLSLANNKFAYNNEKFLMTKIDSKTFNIISDSKVSEKKIFVLDISDENALTDFYKEMTFGYSITVNKSQGLEWDNTCTYITQADKNLFSMNALYVAMSRSKNSVYAVSNFLDRNKTMTSLDIKKHVKRSYKFVNLFDSEYIFKDTPKEFQMKLAKVACVKSADEKISKSGTSYVHSYLVFAYYEDYKNDGNVYEDGDIRFVNSSQIFFNHLKNYRNLIEGEPVFIEVETLYNNEVCVLSKIENINKYDDRVNKLLKEFNKAKERNKYVPHYFAKRINNKEFVKDERVIFVNDFELEI